MQNSTMLGIDIGGTGMKGAIIDMNTGQLLTERTRIPTPQPATPSAMAATFQKLIGEIGWTEGLIGAGFPAIVKNGVAHSASNIHKDWLGTDIEKTLSDACGQTVKVTNDADAAGVAEMKFGTGKGKDGVVMLVTLGTGIGSALFINGALVPNTELGHIYLKGQSTIAEKYGSNKVRKDNELSWDEWGARLNQYLKHIERIFSPNLIILGGGVSKKFVKYADFLNIETTVTPAEYLNNSGIIGAAAYAHQFQSEAVNL